MGLAHFFFAPNQMEDLKKDIQQQLSELDQGIELVAVERPGTEALRLYVDLNHLLAEYSLEVSSPGPKYRRPSPDSDTPQSIGEGEPEEVQ